MYVYLYINITVYGNKVFNINKITYKAYKLSHNLYQNVRAKTCLKFKWLH